MDIKISEEYTENMHLGYLRVSLSELKERARKLNEALIIYNILNDTFLDEYIYMSGEGKVVNCSLELYPSTSLIKISVEGQVEWDVKRNEVEDYKITNEFIIDLVERVSKNVGKVFDKESGRFKLISYDITFDYDATEGKEKESLYISTSITDKVRRQMRHELMGLLQDIGSLSTLVDKLEKENNLADGNNSSGNMKGISTDFHTAD